jgi:aryl-alcohol dehydrogenase
LVFGLGSVGQTALVAANCLDAGHIFTVDVIQEKLDIGKDLGATRTVNSREQTDMEAIKKITKGGTAYTINYTVYKDNRRHRKHGEILGTV